MNKNKIIIIILSVVVVLQGALLLRSCKKAQPKKKPVKISLPVTAKKPKIAIVLDDWGYNANNLQILKEIKSPLTLSVLPNLPFSKKVSTEAHAAGFEIIMHLPMEPSEKLRLERDTILTTSGEQEIKNILNKDLSSIAYVIGVSNHMGSAATKDLRTMTIIFSILKPKRLFFLDSYVSSTSVCWQLSQKMGIGFAKRDIFLDNINDPGYIKSQINKLKSRAKIYGQAIGIGHDRKATLMVLKEMLPYAEKEGYEFVFVSELVR